MSTAFIDDIAEFADFLTDHGIRFRSGIRMGAVTTFRLGGECPLLVDAVNADQVFAVVRELINRRLPFFLMGGGSNLLVSDRGLTAVVVRYVAPRPIIRRDGRILDIDAGTSLDSVAAYCCENGLAGFVNTSGIPGTLGGAVYGNAGAFGWQVADVVKSVTLLDHQAHVRICIPEELGFRYRHSDLKVTKEIVLSATFQVEEGDADALMAKRQEILDLRASKHPNLANDSCAGSFFRNIEPTSAADRRQAAGWFLERAGAKEMTAGGAGVFHKHANIPIKARSDCTAADVYRLTMMMAEAVAEKFELVLEPEVQLIGEFGKVK
jgi:UDP-N-acetylmuramate dehydrogenase